MLNSQTTIKQPLSAGQVLSILIGLCFLIFLAAAPIAGTLASFWLFHFIPSQLLELGIPPGTPTAPESTVGFCAILFSLLIEACFFLIPFFFFRLMRKAVFLASLLLSFFLASVFISIWALGGLIFSASPDAATFFRLIGLLPIGFYLAYRLRPRGIAFWGARGSDWRLALGASSLLLLPWMVLGALGSKMQTLSAFAQAASMGIGEELLLRAIVPLLIMRVTGRIRLGLWIGFLAGVLMQPGYFLPLGNWLSLFRVINAFAIGLLATEFAARGALLPAMLVHTAFEFGMPGFVDSRMQFQLPHPAALESLGIACLLALFFFLFRRLSALAKNPPGVRRRAFLSAGFATVALAASGFAWAIGGNPGFTEDGFLIIFKQQSNFASMSSMQTERAAYVYQQLVGLADGVQAPYRKELQQMGVSFRSHYLINMIEVEGRPDLMSAFAGRPDVSQVIVNPNVRTVRYVETLSTYQLGDSPEASKGVGWNIDMAGAPKVWAAGFTGKGIVVASADTGVEWTHPAIQNRYRGWQNGSVDHAYNWLDAWDNKPAAWDDNGHGTHTVGTMVGDDGQGNQVGMAPGAQWIACRNMRYGIGNPGSYVTCLEFFLAPYPTGGDALHDGRPWLGAMVVNNSWGCPTREGCQVGTLGIALQHLYDAGIMMVAAAGNEGPACNTVQDPPATDANVFTVGAVDKYGKLTSFSSKGPIGVQGKPDVVAPGEGVRSSLMGGGYTALQGTSMASPHVTGLVALLWSANPHLRGDISNTEEIIRRTAFAGSAQGGACPLENKQCFCGRDFGNSSPNNEYGFGRIDAWKAYLEALRLP
jgi:hypothetical protein